MLITNISFDGNLNQNEIDKPSPVEKFKFPLNTQAQIIEFNKEISNSIEYKNYLIKTYCTIGGTEGNEDGKIIAKKLLSKIFTKYVLTLYSWTGISRTAGLQKKEAFQSYEGILSFFHEVVQMADSRWNKEKNERFFKIHTLKHAKQMNAAHEKKKKNKEVAQSITETDFDTNNDMSFSTDANITYQTTEDDIDNLMQN